MTFRVSFSSRDDCANDGADPPEVVWAKMISSLERSAAAIRLIPNRRRHNDRQEITYYSPVPTCFSRSLRTIATIARNSALLRSLQRLCHEVRLKRDRSEEHTSELQSRLHLVCRL